MNNKIAPMKILVIFVPCWFGKRYPTAIPIRIKIAAARLIIIALRTIFAVIKSTTNKFVAAKIMSV